MLISLFSLHGFTERYFFMPLRHPTPKAGFGPALLTAAALSAALLCGPAAQAQTLELGQFGSTTLSGIATLTATGTTASGTYNYSSEKTGKPLASQNSYSHWYVSSQSTANITGGSIGTLNTYDTSTTNVSGGNIGELDIRQNSTVNISGGSSSALITYDTSTVNISGGNFNSGGSFNGYLLTTGPSTVNISGGNFNYLSIEEISTANVSGGNFNYFNTFGSSTANVIGGSIINLETLDTSVLNLFGTDFSETFLGSGSGYQLYNVMGTLQNGNPLNASYYDAGGTLEFNGVPANAVPEASSVVSLSLLLMLGLGGLAASARRRKVPAAE